MHHYPTVGDVGRHLFRIVTQTEQPLGQVELAAAALRDRFYLNDARVGSVWQGVVTGVKSEVQALRERGEELLAAEILERLVKAEDYVAAPLRISIGGMLRTEAVPA